MTIPHAITLALAEIDHARAKHNWSIESPETSDGERFRILRDEVNEVALEAFRFIPAGSDRSNLRTELAQVAACALRWLAVEMGGVERKEREERHIDLAKLRAAAEAGQDHLFNSALIFDLLAELERLYGIEVLHIVHSATVESVAEVLGPERLEAADGYQDAAVKALVAKVDRLTAERDALAAKLEEVTRERDAARAALDKMTGLRNEAATQRDDLLAASVPCEHCGGPAACLGHYGGGDSDEPGFACDKCCGHGNEDGWCHPVRDLDGYVSTLLVNLAGFRDDDAAAIARAEAAERERDGWTEAAQQVINLFDPMKAIACPTVLVVVAKAAKAANRSLRTERDEARVSERAADAELRRVTRDRDAWRKQAFDAQKAAIEYRRDLAHAEKYQALASSEGSE